VHLRQYGRRHQNGQLFCFPAPRPAGPTHPMR
jgi:hypothetical protein